MKYVKGLDTLRTLAVFFVIVDHWGPYYPEHSIKQYIKIALVEDGGFGVNLFFVLSGFLITSILLAEKIKNTEGRNLQIIKNFFVRRTLRIFPIYYLFIFICLITQYHDVPSRIWYYLTYTSNILSYRTNEIISLAHTWSLSVEEQFYLVWPWIIIYANWKHIKKILYSLVVLGVVSKFVVVFVLHHRYPVLVFNCFDSFGIGGLYAYARLNAKECRRFERGTVILLPFLLFMAWRMSSFGGSALGVTYSLFVNSIIALGLIMFVLNNRSEWVKNYILENRFLNFFGKISYGIYLYHYVLGTYLDLKYDAMLQNGKAPAILQNYVFRYGLKLGILIAICWLSFILIEQPVLRLKKRFEYSS